MNAKVMIAGTLLLAILVATTSVSAATDLPWLMVVGGDNEAADSVELLSLDGIANPIPDCLQELNGFPIRVTGAAGASLQTGSTPFGAVCGGWSFDVSASKTESDLCHAYDPGTDGWTEAGRMPVRMDFAGHDSDSDWGLVMSGGYGLNGALLDTVLRTGDGAAFEALPPLPEPRTYHCLAIIDEDTLFVGGGFPTLDGAYVFRRSEGMWTALPDMPRQRELHACQAATNAVTGEREVVVAGGFGGETVDIFNFAAGAWRTAAEPFPQPTLCCSATVPYVDSFLVVGGLLSDQVSDLVYEYDPETEGWIERPERLAKGRSKPAAMLVDPVTFPTCDK